ncbi:nucleoside-diphosphate sugar epimerase, partial [Aeromonas media]
VILRPAMLLGHRQPPRRSEQIVQAIYPWIKPLLQGPLRRWRAIEASQVAHAMTVLANQAQGVEIVQNERLLTL